MNKTHNILIVEDDRKLSDLMKLLLSGQKRFNVAGVAQSFEEAVSIINSKKIDLSIIDIDLKGKKNGIDVVSYIAAKSPETMILVHTVHADSAVLFDAIKAGAGGYVLKGLPPAELLDSINRICDGDVPISPAIARKILSSFRQSEETVTEKLSEREVELLKLSDQGYQQKQIAEMLNLSIHTVYTHFKNIYQKLQVNSSAAALSKAKKLSYL